MRISFTGRIFRSAFPTIRRQIKVNGHRLAAARHILLHLVAVGRRLMRAHELPQERVVELADGADHLALLVDRLLPAFGRADRRHLKEPVRGVLDRVIPLRRKLGVSVSGRIDRCTVDLRRFRRKPNVRRFGENPEERLIPHARPTFRCRILLAVLLVAHTFTALRFTVELGIILLMETYTRTEAAEYLGISPRMLGAYLQSGRLAYDGTNGARTFSRAALDAFDKTRKPRPPLGDDTWAKIEARYRAGEDVAALAREFGVTGIRIRLRLGPRGPAANGHGKRLPEETWEEIVTRARAGEVIEQLVREYGVSRSNIRRRLERAGERREA